MIQLASLTSLCLILYLFESQIPRPVPWIKIGLANVVILVALLRYGLKMALLVSFFKSVVGGFLLGSLFTPIFLLSLSGGLISTLVMGGFMLFPEGWFGPVGISIIGAFTHLSVQLVAAYFLFIKKLEIFYLFPYFTILAVIVGSITGLIAHQVNVRISRNEIRQSI